MSVDPARRYQRGYECPVCGGSKDDPAGHGVRCFGFQSDDDKWAHCTREDYAGTLTAEENGGTYGHRLTGSCRCGQIHDAASPAAVPSKPPVNPVPKPVPSVPKPRKAIKTIKHALRDVDGHVIALHGRIYFDDGDKKQWWELPDGSKGLGGIKVVDLPLYGCHELPRDVNRVVVTEGEPARDALILAGIHAVGTVTGARSIPSAEVLSVLLRYEEIVLWADNDKDGQGVRHMERIKEGLEHLGHRNAVLLTWPEGPEGGDAADFLKMGGTPEQITQMIADASHSTLVPILGGSGALEHPGWSFDLEMTESGSILTPRSEVIAYVEKVAVEASVEFGHDPELLLKLMRASIERLRFALPSGSGLVRADKIETQSVSWFWSGWLPEGKLVLLVGYPGEGKTLFSTDIAARISAGKEWPDGSGYAPERNVIMVNLEDGKGDTLKPRLMAAGAELRRVFFWDGPPQKDGTSGYLDLSRDIPVLEELIRVGHVGLVVLDPLSALLGKDTNAWRDDNVRGLLTPLAAMAERTGVLVIGVMHPNKSGEMKAIQRVSSSIAFGAAPRVVIAVMRDPNDDKRRILGQFKNNLMKEQSAHSIEPVGVEVEGVEGTVPALVWHGEAEGADVKSLMEGKSTKGGLSKLVAEAVEFVEGLMNGADFMPSEKVDWEAERHGISAGSLHKARSASGYRSAKIGDPWWWVKSHISTKDLIPLKHEILKSWELWEAEKEGHDSNISKIIGTGKSIKISKKPPKKSPKKPPKKPSAPPSADEGQS